MASTIIVSGRIVVQPGRRDEFLAASREAMQAARGAPGCRAFVVAGDPLEADTVNVYEQWDDETSLLKFRGEGPSSDMRALIASADVKRHQVSSSGPP